MIKAGLRFAQTARGDRGQLSVVAMATHLAKSDIKLYDSIGEFSGSGSTACTERTASDCSLRVSSQDGEERRPKDMRVKISDATVGE